MIFKRILPRETKRKKGEQKVHICSEYFWRAHKLPGRKQKCWLKKLCLGLLLGRWPAMLATVHEFWSLVQVCWTIEIVGSCFLRFHIAHDTINKLLSVFWVFSEYPPVHGLYYWEWLLSMLEFGYFADLDDFCLLCI